VPSEVIEPSPEQLERDIRDSRGAMVGCVTTDSGLISVTVTRPPSTVDLCVEERLADGDPEGLMDSVGAVIEHRRTVAGIDLDAAGIEGLLRLIHRATQICARLNTRAGPIRIQGNDWAAIRLPGDIERRQLGLDQGVPVFEVHRANGEEEIYPTDRTHIVVD
jgi:hypothetical protein